MTDRLSREAITEYRAEVARGDENRGFTGVMVSHHHLRTLLDAYEAQRKCPGTVDSCTSTAVLERIKVALDRPGVSQSYVDWARECRAAWEASRPRPASEVPEDPSDALVYVCGEWRESLYSDGQWRIYAEDGLSYDPGQQAVAAWLPLPPTPERDDG